MSQLEDIYPWEEEIREREAARVLNQKSNRTDPLLALVCTAEELAQMPVVAIGLGREYSALARRPSVKPSWAKKYWGTPAYRAGYQAGWEAHKRNHNAR